MPPDLACAKFSFIPDRNLATDAHDDGLALDYWLVGAKIEHMSDRWIRASEIGAYVFCNRAWWLARRHGAHSANVREMELGTQRHQAHSQQVARVALMRRLAYLLLALAGSVLIFTLLSL
jgi:hypothetical protein